SREAAFRDASEAINSKVVWWTIAQVAIKKPGLLVHIIFHHHLPVFHPAQFSSLTADNERTQPTEQIKRKNPSQEEQSPLKELQYSCSNLK
ncbi:hypothetical protein HDU76_000423, partial [Blyttiomyces sp. JEL0837]